MSNLALVLLLVILLSLFGVIPVWPHSANWGYVPPGVVLVLLIVVLVLAIRGKL